MKMKELKELINLVLVGIDAGKSVMADGKIGVDDLSALLMLAPALQPALEGIGDIPQELKDMKEEDVAELAAYVMGRLAVDNDKAKEVVAAAIKVILAVYAIIKAVQK